MSNPAQAKSELFQGYKLHEPAEEYHQAKDYISSSPLPKMAKSPLHFYNSWTQGEDETTAMANGTFIHSLLLEQDIERFAPRPVKENGDLVASNTNAYKEWAATIGDKTPIHPELYSQAMAILTSACKSSFYLKAFESCHKEISCYVKHEPTGLYLKSRKDMLAKDYSYILDVKSTADISTFEQQIFKLGYDVRLIHYAEVIRALTGSAPKDIYFFAIESKAPYEKKMFRLSNSAVEAATIEWNTWMNEIAVCIKENNWPGYPDVINDAQRPKYIDRGGEVEFAEVG